MADFRDWSNGWIKEGDNISFTIDGVTYYERVLYRDLAHYEWPWGATEVQGATPITISANSSSGPFVPAALEMTKGYDADRKTNRIWQIIFGIKGQALIYIELPTDLKRHGLPKLRWPSTTVKPIAHFDENMSPYLEPRFITEHFMKYQETYRIEFEAYNPHDIDLTDVWLNFFINKMETERLGKTYYEAGGLRMEPTRDQYREVLKALHQRTIPCRPISLMPVRAPAVASASGV